MKSPRVSVLSFAIVAALCSGQVLAAEKAAPETCAGKTTACCPAKGAALDLKAVEESALKMPGSACCVLKAEVARHPEALQAITVAIVGAFAEKLPAKELGSSLHAVMRMATELLSQQMGAPALTGTPTEEQKQAALAQDLMLAGAVQELTQKAAEAVRQRLTAPSSAVGPIEEQSMELDPLAYGQLMKGSMEQLVRGALAGLGERAGRIPGGHLPSLAMIRQDPGSYSYSLGEAPLAEIVPSAVAAPVGEKK